MLRIHVMQQKTSLCKEKDVSVTCSVGVGRYDTYECRDQASLPCSVSLAATLMLGERFQHVPEDGRHDILSPGCCLARNAIGSSPLMGPLQAATGLPAGRQEAQQLWQQRRVQ